MNLDSELAAWGGKSAADIGAIYERHCALQGFSERLIELIHSDDLQKGATWLLKKYLESGGTLDNKQISTIYNSLSALQQWETKLHVLQCVPYMAIASGEKRRLENFLRKTLTDSNKFVRAWSYNGFYELARQHPEYVAEAKQFFEMAMRDEAASVKARIRTIVKRGF